MMKDPPLNTPIGKFAAARAHISVTGDYQVEGRLSILAKNRCDIDDVYVWNWLWVAVCVSVHGCRRVV